MKVGTTSFLTPNGRYRHAPQVREALTPISGAKAKLIRDRMKLVPK